MADSEPARWIVPTEDAKTLPAQKILTGRGFITGKSGSGKSNSASVIAEELLDNNYNLLIVDAEGEYFGLKESYEMLHVGNADFCDVQVGPDNADQIATIALEQNVPVILDVSDFLDGDEAEKLIAAVVRALYTKEKSQRKPFLIMVEEMQEYLPQQGGTTELSELLERVAKRGRKHGLGLLGMSQRPSSVDKDFITQCDWMVWHRLNWKNDLDVVRNILGSEKADEIENFEPGEAYLMTDWDDAVERVKFSRKRTHDAGATPGLESYERPDLKAVSANLISAIENDEDLSNGDFTGGEQAAAGPPWDDAAQAAGPDASAPRDGEAGSEFPVQADGSIATGTTGEAGDGAPVAQPEEDLDSLDPSELRLHAETLQQQNQRLRDEVSELRSILDGSSHRRSPGGKSPGMADRAAEPARPQPPARPVNRSGLAGNLIEFMAMTSYLLKSLVYRLRLVKFKLAGSSK